MYKLKFSNYIYEDIQSSINYIKYNLQNQVAAQRLKNEIKKAYKKIKENPFIYPAVPVEHLALKGYRFTMVKNYMLFFKVKEKQINIDRFLYGPRDWINILKETNVLED
jgi:plasmid stabilization system protein ParE